jgi:hypothetical protein
MVLLPAMGTLYFALALIWGLPKPEEVVGTIVALDTFLGVLLRISDARYDASDAKYDGNIIKTPTADGQLVYAIQFETRAQQERAHGKDDLLLKLVR